LALPVSPRTVTERVSGVVKVAAGDDSEKLTVLLASESSSALIWACVPVIVTDEEPLPMTAAPELPGVTVNTPVPTARAVVERRVAAPRHSHAHEPRHQLEGVRRQ
jgi:hypothetical protein